MRGYVGSQPPAVEILQHLLTLLQSILGWKLRWSIILSFGCTFDMMNLGPTKSHLYICHMHIPINSYMHVVSCDFMMFTIVFLWFSLILRIQRAQHAFGHTTRQMIRTNDIILQVQHWAADAKPQTRQPRMPCQTLVISIALTDLPEEFANHLSFTGCKYNDFV